MSYHVRDWIESLTTCQEVRDYYRRVPSCWHGWKPSQCPVSAECRITARAAANARQAQQLAEWSERLRAQRTQGNVTQ